MSAFRRVSICALTICAIALLFAVSGFSQTPAPAPAPGPAKYLLDMTIGFDRYDSPRFKGGVGFAFPVTDPAMTTAGTMEHNTFLSIQYDVTSKYSTTLAEGIRVAYRHPSQRALLFLLAGAGATSGNGAVAGAYDAGAGIKFAPFKKLLDFGIIGAVRVKQLNGLGTYLAPTFGVSYTLR